MPRFPLLLGLGAVLACAVSCGYIALPGGLTVNFPGFTGDPIPEPELRRRVQLPEGFFINTYAGGIDGPRMLLFTPSGDLLVSTPRQGKVLLLGRDANGDGYADGERVLLEGLYQPHGLALHDGWLYVAETTAVRRARFDAGRGTLGGGLEPLVSGLPDGGNHWTRTIGIGPDGKLYVSVGSSCNVCIDDGRRAVILRYRLDGSGEQLYATGLRNAVGFAWQPVTGDLYATDNGRDLLGDDFPPEELDLVVEGGFYGWPFASGDRVPDPDYGAGNEARIAASIPPVFTFTPHSAPLGITFYTTPATAAPAAFPARYDGAAFVALHGSWNRSRKSGYEVVALHFAADGTISEEHFATGFLVDDEVYGRPVDVAQGPDGALYVSDDFTGQIYRIAYRQAAQGSGPAAAAATPAADPLAGLTAREIEAANAHGAALWQANGCAACHAAGQAAADAYRPLTGLRGKYGIASMAAFLRTPQPPMPVYPFSDAERRELAIYLLGAFP
jgi:glucose/arabinose dehydrogenase